MKNKAMYWVAITTVILITVTIMAAMNFSFNWVFYLTVLGQIMVVNMVYKVLTDHYTTNKTFKGFYEDHPMNQS